LAAIFSGKFQALSGHKSLTTSAVGYPSDSWAFCFAKRWSFRGQSRTYCG